MNSYNENLHAAIVSSLSDQELEMQQVKAALNASKFSLFYAQGETITSIENLHKTSAQSTHQQKILNEAIITSNISANVLASANSSKSLVAEAVSKTAVAAANIQIAANAILKLAGDIGSIFNSVNAADCGLEIYNQSEYVNKIIAETAYLAEETSQIGMEASTSIAEVTVSSIAITTDASIKNLLEATKTNFKDKIKEVTAANKTLTAANTKEKLAQGLLEENYATFCASDEAYNFSNKEFNLNLTVLVSEPEKNTGKFIVSFNRYKSAFLNSENVTSKQEDTIINVATTNSYPVEAYYLVLVKNDYRNIFSIPNAEEIILKDEKTTIDGKEKYRYVKMQPAKNKKTADNNVAKSHFSQELFLKEILDSDENSIQLGKYYVIFILAKLTNNYKKLINVYDNYLSAPSKAFKITTHLNAVDNDKIAILDTKNNTEIALNKLLNLNNKTKKIKNLELTIDDEIYIKDGKLSISNTINTKQIVSSYKQVVVFATSKNDNNNANTEYRCLFLPNNPNTIKNFLTAYGLTKTQKRKEDNNQTELDWMLKIGSRLDEIKACELSINLRKEKLKELNRIIDSDKKITKKIIDEEKAITNTLKKDTIKLSELEKELTQLKEKKNYAPKKLEITSKVPEFYLDVNIAENIPYGSYTAVVKHSPILDFNLWYFQIQASTTDCFGNPLQLNEDYIPVILTMANNKIDMEKNQFTRVISKITEKGIFTYRIPYVKNAEKVTLKV